MKKWLSYIFPFTSKIKTDYNDVVEVTWYNGQKLLDSKNANYSYGSLQRILEIGISKIDLTKVTSILLLGLGGGSIIASLQNKFSYQGTIDAVEIDGKIIAIAEKEFAITSSKKVNIIHQDAYKYIQNHPKQYDLMIIDLFIDRQVPQQFLSEEFCKNLETLFHKHGQLLFNLGIELTEKDQAYHVVEHFKKHPFFKTTLYNEVEDLNTLLMVEKA